jgi:PKD repeat protein
MSNVPRPRPVRPLELLPVVALLGILLLSGLAGALPAAGVHGASRPTFALPALLPASGPLQSCPGGNPGFWTQMTLASPATNGTWNATQWTIGPAPISVTMNLSVVGVAINYTAFVSWGDGNIQNTLFDKTSTANASQVFQLNHTYTIAALFSPLVWTNYTCAAGPGSNATGSDRSGGSLTIFGAAGPNPISVTASLRSAPVPANITFNATIADPPWNATALWTLFPDIGGTELTLSEPVVNGGSGNTSTYTPDLTVPGLYDGSLEILYTGSGLVYAETTLPTVNVTPLVLVPITFNGTIGNSPWNVTFWGNATNLTGATFPLGSDTESWSFFDAPAGYVNNTFWAYGPTVGTSVWREFYLNGSGGWGISATASIVRPDGVTVGTSVSYITLYSNPTQSNNPSLSFQVAPNNGSAPLYFNVTALLNPFNASLSFDLQLGAVRAGGGSAWFDNVTNWNGSSIVVPGVLTQGGRYFLYLNVLENESGSLVWVAGGNQSMLVTPLGSGGTPVLNLAVSAVNGSAPLNFTVTTSVTGYNGTIPLQFDLQANLSTGQTPAEEGFGPWNGSAASFQLMLTAPGSYTLDAEVRAGYAWSNSTWLAGASVAVVVFPATSPAPSLSFSASPGSGSAPLNVTLDFVVAGGTSPFALNVCVEGPFAKANSTGACSAVQSQLNWNGASLALPIELNSSGNYTINATVTDRTGRTSVAQALVPVSSAAPTAPLVARARFVAPNAITASGATYGFVTEVTGGVTPYNIQWSFGDGASGSSVAGGTAVHTYTSSGTYTATLTVTDARGHRATATAGPFVVALPYGGPTTPWWASTGLLALAAVVGVASAILLLATMQRLARRREALNWFREIEERPGSNEPVPRSR